MKSLLPILIVICMAVPSLAKTMTGDEISAMAVKIAETNKETREGRLTLDLLAMGVDRVELSKPLVINTMVYFRCAGVRWECVGNTWKDTDWAITFNPAKPKSTLSRMIRRDLYISGLNLQCNWKCRGIQLVDVDRSVFESITIDRPKGCALGCDDLRESNFYSLYVQLGCKGGTDPLVNVQMDSAPTDGSNNVRFFGCQFHGSEHDVYVRVATANNRARGNSNPTRLVFFETCYFHKPWDKLAEVAKEEGFPGVLTETSASQRLVEVVGANGVHFADCRFRIPDAPGQNGAVRILNANGIRSQVVFDSPNVNGQIKDRENVPTKDWIKFIDPKSAGGTWIVRNPVWQGQVVEK
jgi:hypothetical protein